MSPRLTLATGCSLALLLLIPSRSTTNGETSPTPEPAEIYGTISFPGPGGRKAANAEITGAQIDRSGKPLRDCQPLASTDVSGTYALKLPPGNYRFQITDTTTNAATTHYFIDVFVSPTGGQQNLTLKDGRDMALPSGVPLCTKP